MGAGPTEQKTQREVMRASDPKQENRSCQGVSRGYSILRSVSSEL